MYKNDLFKQAMKNQKNHSLKKFADFDFEFVVW